MSMVRAAVRSGEWWVGDKRKHLGWIRLVHYQGRPTFVCVTRSEWVVGCGDSLADAARAFHTWSNRPR
jgi:hypothetical protein